MARRVTTRRGHVAVVLAALCFGSTFPVTKEALGDIGPYAVVGIRFLLGGLALLPFAVRHRGSGRREVVAVAWCSLALLTGYLLLTVGLQRTTSTAAAFICYLLVVIVPVLSAVLLRRVPTLPVLLGVAFATAGLFLLAGDGLRPGAGELLVLGCALAFAVHILLLDHWAGTVHFLRLAAFQLVAVGLLALVPAAVRGELRGLGLGSLAACAFLAAAGVGGLVLQIAGQRTVGPTRTSLLLMIEPVLAAVGGYAIGERIAPVGFLGAALILIGIVVSEVPLDRPVSEAR
jgi:drug/metabolite transporter (DMT)-like permease